MKNTKCRNFANEVYRWYSAVSKYFETSVFREFNRKLYFIERRPLMYRRDIITYSTSTVLVLLAAALHLMDELNIVIFPVNALVFFLYTTMIILWAANMESRILRTESKRLFRMITALLIGYIGARTLKYEIFYNNPTAVAYIRYFYYFFSINVVHLVFQTTLLVGKSERESTNKWWKLLWIPTELLVLLVLTNDCHSLIFATDIPQSVETYKPGFYIIVIYLLTLTLASLYSTIRATRHMRSPWPIILPITTLAILVTYTFLYIFEPPFFYYFKIAFKSAEFNILMIILFIESLVFTRLIPSNRGYERFMKLSSLQIGLADKNGKIILASDGGPDVSPQMIDEALGSPLLIDDDTILESANIQGGKSFWFVDLSDFNALKKHLVELNEEMLNENEILKANNALRKKMVQVEEQRKIRDHLQRRLKPQFDQLRNILMNLPEDEDAFEEKLKHACFIDVYIKRYSNLFLLTKNKKLLDLDELRLAFSESLDYLSLTKLKTSLDWDIAGIYNARVCLAFYEIFQYALEFYMPGVDCVYVSLKRINKVPELHIKITGARAKSFLDEYGQAHEKIGISISESIGKDEINLSARLERRDS